MLHDDYPCQPDIDLVFYNKKLNKFLIWQPYGKKYLTPPIKPTVFKEKMACLHIPKQYGGSKNEPSIKPLNMPSGLIPKELLIGC